MFVFQGCGGIWLALMYTLSCVEVIHCHCLWWWYTVIVEVIHCHMWRWYTVICGGDTLSLFVVVIHCHCLWKCRTDCVKIETVITVWRCMTNCDTNTLSLLCFRSVEICDQPWHRYIVLVNVMFQVCGDEWSAMTQIHCHCYVSGLWRWVVKHEINTLSMLCFRSVEVYGQLSSDSFNVEALFQSIGKFVGVFAGAFAIGSLFGIATAFVSFSWYFPHHCLVGECSWLL